MPSTQTPKIVESHCNRCLRITKHDLGKALEEEWVEHAEDGAVMYWETILYELLQCRGCGHVSMRRTYRCSGMPEADIDYFPPAVSRRSPEWLGGLAFIFDEIMVTLRELFAEVYSAVYSGNSRLALMGCRTILDVALTDKLGDVRGFGKKLEEACNKNWITKAQTRILGAAIGIGSAVSHRAFKPTPKQLESVLNIVENTIQLLYVLEPTAEKLAKQTPKRKRNKPRKQ